MAMAVRYNLQILAYLTLFSFLVCASEGNILNGSFKPTDKWVVHVGDVIDVNCTLSESANTANKYEVYITKYIDDNVSEPVFKRYGPNKLNMKVTVTSAMVNTDRKIIYNCYLNDSSKPNADWLAMLRPKMIKGNISLPTMDDVTLRSAGVETLYIDWCPAANRSGEDIHWNASIISEIKYNKSNPNDNEWTRCKSQDKGVAPFCNCSLDYGIHFVRNHKYLINITGFSQVKSKSTILTILPTATHLEPGRVRDLKATEITPNKMRFTWRHPQNLEPEIVPLVYEDYVFSPEDENKYMDKVGFDENIKHHEKVIGNLIGGATYNIGVRTKTPSGIYWSKFSNITITMTSTVPLRNPVTRVSSYISSTKCRDTCRQVQIYFQKIPRKYAGGKIIHYLMDGDKFAGCDRDKLYCEVNGLEFREKYNFIIRGETSAGAGPNVTESSFQLHEDGNGPKPPMDVWAEIYDAGTDSTTMVISWTSLNTPPELYVVYYHASKEGLHMKTVNGTVNSTEIVVFHGSRNIKDYQFSVAAENGSMSQGMSAWVRCLYQWDGPPTAKVSLPEFAADVAQEERSLTVQWQKVTCGLSNGRPLQYVIKYIEVKVDGSPQKDAQMIDVSLPPSVSSYTITELKEEGWYNVSLSVLTRGGNVTSGFVKKQVIKREKPVPVALIIVGATFGAIVIVAGIVFGIHRLWSNIAAVEIKLPPRELDDLPGDEFGELPATSSSPMMIKVDSNNSEECDVFDERKAMISRTNGLRVDHYTGKRTGRQISYDSGTGSMVSCSTQMSVFPSNSGSESDDGQGHSPTSHNSSFGNNWDGSMPKRDKSPLAQLPESDYCVLGQTESQAANNSLKGSLNGSPPQLHTAPSDGEASRAPPVPPPPVGSQLPPRNNHPMTVNVCQFQNPYLSQSVLDDMRRKEEKEKAKQRAEMAAAAEQETSFNGLPSEYSKVAGIASSDEAMCFDSETEGEEGSSHENLAMRPMDRLNNKGSTKSLEDIGRRVQPKPVTPYVKDIDLAIPKVKGKMLPTPYIQADALGPIAPPSMSASTSGSSTPTSDAPSLVDPRHSSILPQTPTEESSSQKQTDNMSDTTTTMSSSKDSNECTTNSDNNKLPKNNSINGEPINGHIDTMTNKSDHTSPDQLTNGNSGLPTSCPQLVPPDGNRGHHADPAVLMVNGYVGVPNSQPVVSTTPQPMSCKTPRNVPTLQNGYIPANAIYQV